MFNQAPSMREAAQLHLEERYGGRFEFIMPWGVGYFDRGITQMMFARESEINNVLVVGRRTDDGFAFDDNYLAIKFREEMFEFIRRIATDVFGEAIVLYSVSNHTLSPDLPANVSFEEYSTDPMSNIFANIVLTEQLISEPLINVFSQKFQKTGIFSMFNFLIINEEWFNSVDPLDINTPIAFVDTHHFATARINNTEITIDIRED